MSAQLELNVSGRMIRVIGVELYPSEMVAEWRRLLAAAQQQLGGVSTGIGFLGSPEWAVGGGLALGLLEGVLSSASAKSGLQTLEQAALVLRRIRSAGKIFEIQAVAGLDGASPAAWSAPDLAASRAVDVGDMSIYDRGKFLIEQGLTKEDVRDGHVYLPSTSVSLGEEFISFQLESETLLRVRWTSVASIQLCPA